MQRTKLVFSGIAAALLALAPVAVADNTKTAAVANTKAAESLSLDKIVSKHIAALGGEKLLRSTKTMAFTVSGEKLGKSFTKSVTYARGNKMRVDIVSADGPMSKGFDGKVAWTKKGNEAAVAMTAEETTKMASHADMDEPLLDYAKKGTTLKLVGLSEVDSVPAYDLELTTKSGEVEHHFLDAKSFLLVKRTFVGKDKDGKSAPMAVRFGDYKKVQGRMVNHSVTWEGDDGKLHKSSVTNIKFDRPVDAKLFAMPK